jgi:hypothetical protein
MLVDQPGVHVPDDGRLRLVDREQAVLADAVPVGDDASGVAAFAGGPVDALLRAFRESADLGRAKYALDAEHDEIVEVVGAVGAFGRCDRDRMLLAGADDAPEVFESRVAGEPTLLDHQDHVELVLGDHLEQLGHAGAAGDGAPADPEVLDDGAGPAACTREPG